VADVGPQAGPVGDLERLVEHRDLARVDRVVGAAVGEGEVAEQPDRADGAAGLGLRGGLAQLGPVGGGSAVAVQAGVGLEVQPGRGPGAAGSGDGVVELLPAADAEVDAGAHRVVQRLAGGVQPGQHRRLDPGRAQLQGLLEERDAEPGRPALERGPGAGEQPVAVAVGLDHGHHRGPAGGVLAQRGGVGAQGRQLDPGLRAGHAQESVRCAVRPSGNTRAPRSEPDVARRPAAASGSGRCWQVLPDGRSGYGRRTARAASGQASSTAEALVGRAGAASDPASPCRCAPTAPASSGSSPPASSAPVPPASTSPVPAVASAGVPVRLTRHGRRVRRPRWRRP
jgi:hypothetical protein